MEKSKIIDNCKQLLNAYENGELWYMKMPEDSKPKVFDSFEEKLVYFTLPMSINYRRDSYKLWEWSLKTYNDKDCHNIFDIKFSANIDTDSLRNYLLKYKLALQPNMHINIWYTISKTVYKNWWTMENLLSASCYDFLNLKKIIQKEYKKWFPYLSWPKMFDYWCYTLNMYCDAKLKNSKYIDIAPDTHIRKCSVKLWIIWESEVYEIKAEELSKKWRNILKQTNINPIDMHSPLWFWSRNGFEYELSD